MADCDKTATDGVGLCPPRCLLSKRGDDPLVVAAGYASLAANAKADRETSVQVIVNHRVYWLDVMWSDAGPTVTVAGADPVANDQMFLDTPTDVHEVRSM